MKSTIIAAAAVALVVGVAAVGGTSVAGPIKFKAGCWPGFIGTNYTGCSKTFYTTCKKGYSTTMPTVTSLGKNKYRVSFGCYVIK